MDEATAGAAALAGLGAFFAVEPDRPGTGWRPLAELVEGPGLGERVDATAEALGRLVRTEVEARVAASTASLGLFARLVSPTLGAAALELPAPVTADLHWRPLPSGPLDLAADRWTPADPHSVLGGPVQRLVDRLVGEHGLSEQVVRGNLASSVHGALQMAARARPELRDRCGALLAAALAHPLLDGTADPGPPFVRRSCCLYYRLPGGGYCGDCVLAHR